MNDKTNPYSPPSEVDTGDVPALPRRPAPSLSGKFIVAVIALAVFVSGAVIGQTWMFAIAVTLAVLATVWLHLVFSSPSDDITA